MARTELTPARQIALAAAWLVFIVGTCMAINARVGTTQAQAPLAGGALPPAVAGAATGSSSSEDQSPSSSRVVVTKTVTAHALPPDVPVAIDIPFGSAHYPDGLHAQITSNPLNQDGSIYVPDDPKTVSWVSQDAAPNSTRGTVILTSHVNFVIDGKLVIGAFADVVDYARNNIGQRFTVTLASGKKMIYQVSAGREYSKDQLAADPGLRTDLYDQSKEYGDAGKPRTSRLLLVSCGGAFDNKTGEYQDNVFLYALPVASAGPQA